MRPSLDLNAPWGKCVYVPSELDDHVYSAKVVEGYGCRTYASDCDPLVRLSGLPYGHKTHALGCWDCYEGLCSSKSYCVEDEAV